MTTELKSPAERLQKTLKEAHLQGAVLTSAENIRYFSGFTSADGWVFVGAGKIALVTDGRYWAQAQQQCPQVELIKYRSHEHRNLAQCLATWLKEVGFSGEVAVEGQSLSLDGYNSMSTELVEQGPVTRLVSQSALINDLRLIKTPQELAAIGKAAEAADRAWEKTLPIFKAGITEADLCAELEYQMQKCGARKPSFDTIVASGLNGAYPHATVTNKVIQPGELVTVDFGCVVDGWCSDITRTIWVDHLDDKSFEIWQVVKKAHDTALEAARPGLKGCELDKIARDIIEQAGYGEYFSHSLGHGVGLAVHEGPGLRRESQTVLEPGMTVTIEPGIYIPYFGGCRIEDLIYITETGHERLSHAPYQIP
ncbi:MAG: Xaa-Pro peptidase family protein [bacterium]|nr:Xaa-Pro peptidase family protein [bacterium]